MKDMTPPIIQWVRPDSGNCPVADTLHALGGKHKPRILHSLAMSDLHFLELTRALDGISRKVLAEQLRDLQAFGLITRTERNDARNRIAYSLSEKGSALAAILSQIYDWSVLYPLSAQTDSHPLAR